MARRYTKRQPTKPQATDDICTALYIRVSTEGQAATGFSLEAQEVRLRAHCTGQDWLVCDAHVYIDAGISGKTTNRAAFQRMMEAAQGGQIRRIVAMGLDRLARNVRDFLITVDNLAEWGCDLVLVKESFDTGTPSGKFFLTMSAAMAELEASTIAERLASGRKQKATHGGYCGGRTPFGYRFNEGRFVVDDREAATVCDIFVQFNAGASLKAIAGLLNKADVSSQQGKQWHASTIRYLLSNGFYTGLEGYNGQKPVEANHTPIIARDIYNTAQLRLDALRPGPARGSKSIGELSLGDPKSANRDVVPASDLYDPPTPIQEREKPTDHTDRFGRQGR